MSNDHLILRTYSGGNVTIHIDQITEIYSNFVKVDMSKSKFIKFGSSKIREFQVYPEDMFKLVDALKQSRRFSSFNLRQVELFLSKFPTKAILDKKLKEDRSLPLD